MRHAHFPRPALQAAFEVARDIVGGIVAAIGRIGEARAKSELVSRLWALSDSELEARGIKREDIVRLVMADAI